MAKMPATRTKRAVSRLPVMAGKRHPLQTCQSSITHCYVFGMPGSKFWNITVWGTRTIERYGLMNVRGQQVQKKHLNKDAAQAFAYDRIKAKIGRECTWMETITTADDGSSSLAPFAGSLGAATVASHVKERLVDSPMIVGELRNIGKFTVMRHLEKLYTCTCAKWRYQRRNIALRL